MYSKVIPDKWERREHPKCEGTNQNRSLVGSLNDLDSKVQLLSLSSMPLGPASGRNENRRKNYVLRVRRGRHFRSINLFWVPSQLSSKTSSTQLNPGPGGPSVTNNNDMSKRQKQLTFKGFLLHGRHYPKNFTRISIIQFSQ